MVSPAGILIKQKSADESLAYKAEDVLRTFSKSISEVIKPTPGPYAFFHHVTHTLERIKDIHCVLNRLYEERVQLRVLDEAIRMMTPDDHASW